MHWHHDHTRQHDSLANFYIIYKSSWEYSQALDDDCLQGLVASVVPGTLWLGLATFFRPGPRHSWGVITEETIPGSHGKGYEWVCVTCTHSLGGSFPAGSTKHQEPWDTSWATGHAASVCGHVSGGNSFASKAMCQCPQTREWLWPWFTNIVIASIYSFPLSDEGGWSSFTWSFDIGNLLYLTR